MLGKGIAGKGQFYSVLGKKYLNKKSFPYGNKINFNSIRKGEVVGEHEVKFFNGKEIIKLNHKSFIENYILRALLVAAKWLIKNLGFTPWRIF